MKRVLRIALAAVLATALIPVTVLAVAGDGGAGVAPVEGQSQTGDAEASAQTSHVTVLQPDAQTRDGALHEPVFAAPAAVPSWALLNLVLAVLTVGAAVALSLGLLGPGGSSRAVRALRTLALAPAAASAAAFLLTQNVSRAMALTDRWTLLMAGIALLQTLIAVLMAVNSGAGQADADA